MGRRSARQRAGHALKEKLGDRLGMPTAKLDDGDAPVLDVAPPSITSTSVPVTSACTVNLEETPVQEVKKLYSINQVRAQAAKAALQTRKIERDKALARARIAKLGKRELRSECLASPEAPSVDQSQLPDTTPPCKLPRMMPSELVPTPVPPLVPEPLPSTVAQQPSEKLLAHRKVIDAFTKSTPVFMPKRTKPNDMAKNPSKTETSSPPINKSDATKTPELAAIDRLQRKRRKSPSRLGSSSIAKDTKALNVLAKTINARVTRSPPRTKGNVMNGSEALELMTKMRCSRRAMLRMNKFKVRGKRMVPSRTLLDKTERLLLAKMPKKNRIDLPNGGYAWTASLIATIRSMLSSKLPRKLPDKVKVVIVGDAGGSPKSTKVGAYIAGFDGALSCANLGLLAVYFGKDDYDNLAAVLADVGREITEIQKDGVITDDGNKLAVEIIVCGDMKFQCDLLGHQGCSTLFFCPYCKTDGRDAIYGKKAASRDLTDHIAAGENVARAKGRFKSKSAITNAMQRNGSVKELPLFMLPFSSYCPPPLHIIQGIFNKMWKYERKLNPEIVAECEESFGQKPSWRGDWSGKVSSNLLDHLSTKQNCGLRMIQAFRILQKIKSFAQARMYESSEIDDLERLIKDFMAVLRSKKYPLIPKMHFLEMHVCDFMRVHGSWGLYSEQSIESLHHQMNVTMDRIKRRRNMEVNIARWVHCFWKHHQLQNMFNNG